MVHITFSFLMYSGNSQGMLPAGEGGASCCALSIRNGKWDPSFSLEDVSTELLIDSLRVLQEEVQKRKNSCEQAAVKVCRTGAQEEPPPISSASQIQNAAGQGDPLGPVPNGAPRPPCMLKDTAPCTSTQAMTPGELLGHLKEVGWYKDQVRS
jgi:hypothetical protein